MWEHIFLKKNAGIFRSVTLPLETLDKIWKKNPGIPWIPDSEILIIY